MKKILLLGAGSIGKRHLNNAVTVGCREIIIVDLRLDRQEEARQKALEAYNILPDRDKKDPLIIHFAKNSAEAYKKHHGIEGVIIAMPPLNHIEEVIAAAEHNCSIFCEKPLCKDDTSDSLIQSALKKIRAKKLVNIVAYNYRFCGQLIKFRELINAKTVGETLTIRGTFSENLREWHPWEGLNFYMSSKKLGGGALLDESHLVDICRWLFGEMTEVAGYNETISSLKNEKIFETDDVVEFMARFESGVIGSIHMDLFGKYHQKKIEVIGETGTIFWHFDNSDLESNRIEVWRNIRGKISEFETRRMPEAIYCTDWKIRNIMYVDLMKYFFDCAKAGKHLRTDVPDIADGLQTIQVLRSIRKSVKSKKFEKVNRVK